MKIKVGNATIVLREGDIALVEADALVNAANDALWMGSGVAGSLKKHGGPEIEAEAIRKGPIGVGYAIATGAGSLKAKYIIHSVVMSQELTTDLESVAAATRAALKLAAELKCKSIALPAFGTGVGALPINDCARTMFKETIKLLLTPKLAGMEQIIFVLYGRDAFEAFEFELNALFSHKK